MNDVTLLYYTARRIGEYFALCVRQQLFNASDALVGGRPPIVTIAHGAPLECGAVNLTVGKQAPSIYQVYRNILLGAQAATTRYVACVEDDTIYAPSHFAYRPGNDTFAYDRNRWVLTRELAPDGRSRVAKFYWRERHQMAMCIAPRQLLVETLEEKFEKYPEPPPSTDVAKKAGWGEPGRYEKNLKLTPRKMEYFDSPEPSVTFNHSESLMGRRRVNPDDVITSDLPPWGDATALWDRIHG